MKPRVEVLYYPDCPSHEAALERLTEALAEAGWPPEVAVSRVETQAQAEALGFIGSPTIRVDGRDIDPVPDDALPMLTCRAYTLEDGRISPLPSKAMILRALGP